MSSSHAEIRGSLGRWTLRDKGSRNGVRVNGAVVSERDLEDGDLIELGHTLLLYLVRRTGQAADDVDTSSAPPLAPGLGTLSPDLDDSFRRLAQLASANVNVLVLGETGTGKEITAQALHRLSRVTGEFVGVNCGAIPQSILEGELFGSSRGAFSGAVVDRPGLVRQAHRGTLFLDEIGDLPSSSQAAFLRVLQERRVRPVGGTQAVPVEFRIVSATNQDIEQLVRGGGFRQDLFARIAGFRLRLPSLRERPEDLGILIGSLLRQIAGNRAESVVFDPAAARRLVAYPFPLNIRELENWLTAAIALADDGPIRLEHLPEPVELERPVSSRSVGDASRHKLTAEQAEHRLEVDALLREHHGNVSAVARATGKARNQVQRWIKRYDLDPNDYR
jgi:transcriptional regulator with PAS, ATPase and Fis domain